MIRPHAIHFKSKISTSHALITHPKYHAASLNGRMDNGLICQNSPFSLGTRGVYLALGLIQCFILVSIAHESPDSKSVGCQAVTLGEISYSCFKKKH